MKVVVISASPRENGKTQHVMKATYDLVKAHESTEVAFINLAEGGIDYYDGNGPQSIKTKKAVSDLLAADVWLIGSPVYNSFFSAALKNLFEFIDYKKTKGKICGLAVIGASTISFMQVQNAVIGLMTYFKVVTNPQTVFVLSEDICDDGKLKDDVEKRLKEMIDSTLSLAR
ncbi:MAG: NADPH-dependent FMN reductase [Cenarchaeum symbiont of Oopsacas minuta]|nr:NADPH-dependent FMN reductase [Cenarchaeum symbiont of Oopsacas minuta]